MRRPPPPPRRIVAVAALAVGLAAFGCDPVHKDQVDALGDEVPGVPHGPLHRPGQPCTLCHDGALGDPPAFSVAGTIYATPSAKAGMANATVNMTDSKGSSYSTTTNAAGNFYVQPSKWTPSFPIVKAVVTASGMTATMYSQIGWASSCANCHTSPEGPQSPGRVVLRLDDGGVAP
jgi:hypothetical protein